MGLPRRDESHETTVPGIWVAGDGGGVAGAIVAELEGTLVGLQVAHRLGCLGERELAARQAPLRRRLTGLRRFRAAVLDSIYRLRPALAELAEADTVACRCERVCTTRSLSVQ